MPQTTIGALLTILQNKLGASDVEANVLLYGSQTDIHQKGFCCLVRNRELEMSDKDNREASYSSFILSHLHRIEQQVRAGSGL